MPGGSPSSRICCSSTPLESQKPSRRSGYRETILFPCIHRSGALECVLRILPTRKRSKMRGLFKSKPQAPADLVRQTRDLLIYIDKNWGTCGSKRVEKERKMLQIIVLCAVCVKIDFTNELHCLLAVWERKMDELCEMIRKLKFILYGSNEVEPVAEACAQLTQEFFRENTLHLLILSLQNLKLEARRDVTQVVANLQRQQVHSRLIASDYLVANTDILDILISGYENLDIALHYGVMLRECIRPQSIARIVLEPEHIKKFFEYLLLPNFDIASDVFATFRELMTRHKSTVAEFLSKNYDWFFPEYNEKLLSSSNYITVRQAIKLLGDMLLDRSNSAVMVRYVRSKDNLILPMNLLRNKSRVIQIEAFHVFKLFVANENKPAEIATILVTNKSKILRLLGSLKLEKEDEQFEADKSQVMKEVATLTL